MGRYVDRVVYWGTTGQKITDTYSFNSFAMAELLDYGMLLQGEDIRDKLKYPTREQFRMDIMHHYNTVRMYAQETNSTIKSVGWFLDIARGLCALETNRIIVKTAAGEWVLAKGLVPCSSTLERVLRIRKNPLDYMNDDETQKWCGVWGGPPSNLLMPWGKARP